MRFTADSSRRILGRRMKFLIAAALVAVGIQQTFAQDASGIGDSQASSPSAIDEADEIDVPQSVRDEGIRERLLGVFNATDWFDDVNVRVRNGVVFLAGKADTQSHADWATELSNNTEGVVAVVNELRTAQTLSWSKSFVLITDSLRDLWRDALAHSPLIVAALAVLLLTWILSWLAGVIVGNTTRRAHVRDSLRDLALQLTSVVVWVAGVTTAAVIVFPGMTPARILTVLGLSSVAIGFAFKDIFENFFAGVLILWRFPFDRGDYIVCGDVEGEVESITIRMTMLRQVDGQLVVVPNAMLFKNPVEVVTSQATRRITVICGVAYGEDVDQSRDVIRTAVQGCSTVRTKERVEIFAQEFADSSINFEVTWWTGSTPLEIRQSRDEVVASVKRALDDAEIEIPFPYRTLTFKEPLVTDAAFAGNGIQGNGSNQEDGGKAPHA